MRKHILLFLAFAGMVFGQCSKTTVNPLTGQLDCTSAAGIQGEKGDKGDTGDTGPAGAPNTSHSFVNETSFTWTHNEGTQNALYMCLDTTVSPPKLIEPDTIRPVDDNSVTITFVVAQTGTCVGNFAGGAGGGNPLWANVLGGTSTATFHLGNGALLDTTGTGINETNQIKAGTTMLGSVLATPIAQPSNPASNVILFVNSADGAFCSLTTLGNLTCTGAPGGGSVTTLTGEGGIESLDATNTVGSITTTGKVRSANTSATQSGTTYTVDTTDRGKLLVGTNAASMAWTLPQAGTSFPNGWCAEVVNDTTAWGSDISITPTTSTINGTTVFKVGKGEYTKVCSDGTNYHALALRPLIVNGVADGSYWDPWGGPFHDVSSTGIVAASANKVYMFYTQLEKPVKISKATFRVQVGSASTHMAVAIYKDASTKIVESASATSTTSGGILQPALGSTVILTPGLYIVAYTTDSTSNAITSINSFPATNSIWTSRPDALNRSWSCLNTSTFAGGAIFPATCGTATQFSTTGPPTMYFEN